MVKRNSCRVLVRKQEERNLLADLDIGWEVNIKTRQASTYNIIMCPCKNCCSGKAIRITYFPAHKTHFFAKNVTYIRPAS
jgi:hypothetical protein